MCGTRFLFFLLILFSIPLFAQPKVHHHIVNGYDVYLVDIQRGNRIAVAYNVLAGASHDDPVRHAGLAHLFEHAIYLGSKKFPGPFAYNEVAQNMGATANAWTFNNHTLHFLHGHKSILWPAIDLLGATISEPLFDELLFRRELSVVMNEAKSYQSQDQFIGLDLLVSQLSPQHPQSMYSLGTQDQLSKITTQDARDFYASNYRPGHAQIIISGNLTETINSPDQLQALLKHIGSSFSHRPSNSPITPSSQKAFPPYEPLNKNQNYLLSEGTDNLVHILFSSTDPIDSRSLQVIKSLITLQTKAGLFVQLRDKGLVTYQLDQPEHEGTRLNNLTLYALGFQLTELGLQKKDEVIQHIFEYIKKIQQHLLPVGTVEKLKTALLAQAQIDILNPMATTQELANVLSSGASANSIFDLKEELKVVTPESIQRAALQMFPLERALVQVNRAIEGTSSEQKDPIFLRGVKVSSLEVLSTERVAPLEINLRELPYGVAKAPRSMILKKQIAREDIQNGISWRLTGRESDTPSGAALIQLSFPKLNPREQLLLATKVIAFNSKLSEEMATLLAHGTRLEKMTVERAQIQIQITGNSQTIYDFLPQYIQRFKNYVPRTREIENAIAVLKSDVTSSASDFVGNIAANEMIDFLNGGESQALRAQKLLLKERSFSSKDVQQNDARLWEGVDMLFSFVGDFSPEEVEQTSLEFKKLFPTPLTEAERIERRSHRKLPRTRKGRWIQLPEYLSTEVGWARAFSGPRSNSKASISLKILGELLETKIYDLNRTQRELGYIQGAIVKTFRNGSFLLLYGETDGYEKAPQIAQGWAEVAQDLLKNPISNELFERLRTNFINTQTSLPDSLVQGAENGLAQLSGESLPVFQVVKNAKELTYAEFLATSSKQLQKLASHRNSLDVFASLTNPVEIKLCESLLKSKK